MYLAGLLPPYPGGRPRERVPDAGLRRSTRRGQSLSNAFFWRSAAATTRRSCTTGLEGGPGVRRRVPLRPGSGSDGDSRGRSERAGRRTTARRVAPPSELHGGRRHGHRLPLHLRPRQRQLHSSLAMQQRYQQDILQATSTSRRIGGNVTGNWGGYVMSVTLEKGYFRTDDVQDHRFAAAGVALPWGAADWRLEAVLRREQRVDHPRTEHDEQRREGKRPRVEPRRGHPDSADSVHALAVPHAELDRLLARHVLDGELRRP